jgi:PAS domain S-box-containing protein
MYENLLDKEVSISSKDILITRTDHAGVMNYGNDSFLRISGYSKDEVIGSKHNLVRHPDMPKVIFHLMWKSIKKRKNITAIIKNLTKDGSYYWVITDFKTQEDYSGAIQNHIAYRRAVPRSALEVIEPFYDTLLRIETDHGMNASLIYLKRYFQERDVTYNEFVAELLKEPPLTELFKNRLKMLFS